VNGFEKLFHVRTLLTLRKQELEGWIFEE